MFRDSGQAGSDVDIQTDVELAEAYLAKSDFLVANIDQIERLLRDAISKLKLESSLDARITLALALSESALAYRRAAKPTCEEVRRLHASIKAQLQIADEILIQRDSLALGYCAFITADPQLFQEAEESLEQVLQRLQKTGPQIDLARAHNNLGTVLLNHAKNAYPGPIRFETLERGAAQFSAAGDI